MNRSPISVPPSTRQLKHRRYLFVALLLLIFVLVFIALPSATGGVSSAQSRTPRTHTNRKPKRQKGRVSRPRNKHIERPDFPASAEEFDGEDPEGRASWFYYKRAYPFGELPFGARRRAWAARPPSKRGALALNGQTPWNSIGPSPTTPRFPNNWGLTSGRINAIAVNPANPQVVIVGASTGGLWRSTDGAQTFVPTSDDQVDLAVGSIAFAPSNPSIVYAGMGDIDNTYVGTGILRSTNGGQTWSRVSNATLPEAGFVGDIVVDPTNPNRVYVAQDVRLNSSNNSFITSGFYVSADGGVNWTKTLAGRARNLAIHPTNPQILYAAMRTVDGGGTSGIYKSTDAGGNWNLVYTSPYLSTATRDIRVAVTAADPERVYVHVGTRTGTTEIRVEVSTNGGVSWTDRGASGVVGLDPGQFGYNTYIYVSPVDPNVVYVGARDIYKSVDGGLTWVNLTKNFHYTVNPTNQSVTYPYNPFLSNTHPDQQSFAFSTSDPNVVYAGNDGGISKSTNGGTNFQSVNSSLSLTQFVHLSLHPTDPNISYGGTQDNGTQRRLPGTRDWVEFNEGDGGKSVINPQDPSMVFSTYIFGAIRRNLNNGISSRVSIANEATFGESASSPRIAFYSPLVGNGVDHRLYFGTWRLFICTNCSDPTKSISSVPPTDWSAPAGTLDLTKGNGDVLNTIAVARSNTNVIYTGSVQGRAMVSTNGGQNWNDITAGLPNRTIESIVIDASNPSNAYLSVSGYGSGHVFKTTNSGVSWLDVSGNLPNIPTNALLIDPLNPNTIYAGTDIGVFRSTSGGSNWETFNDGLPPVIITAFAAQANGRVQAATYGRGAYELMQVAGVAFDSTAVTVTEAEGRARLTVSRSSSLGTASVDYSTSDNSASERSDYTTSRGTLNFAVGELSKTIDVLISDDAFNEPSETFMVTLSAPLNLVLDPSASVATVTVHSNDIATGVSPVRWGSSFDSRFFVRQHYLDFLGREPDDAGLNFWRNIIDSCGTDNLCSEARRVNVSAAFFLAIEFQETGYLSYRTHKAAFGNLPNKPVPITRLTLLLDQQRLSKGVIVGVDDWEQKLETNKRAYFEWFVSTDAFTARYPSVMTAEQFVDTLNSAAGDVLSTSEREQLVSDYRDGRKTRAEVLRSVAEDQTLRDAELNKSFVLMQYVGYLRRDPDASPNSNFDGWQFWLDKLNLFNGNYVHAEMVKAFLLSVEYVERFGT